jgi:hypothetical protein
VANFETLAVFTAVFGLVRLLRRVALSSAAAPAAWPGFTRA